MRSAHSAFESFVKLNKKIPPETLQTVTAIQAAGRLSDTIAGHLNLKLDERQELLENLVPQRRLEDVHARMQAEIEVLETVKEDPRIAIPSDKTLSAARSQS